MDPVVLWLYFFLTINAYHIWKFENVYSWGGYPELGPESMVTVSVSKIVEPEPVILVPVSKKWGTCWNGSRSDSQFWYWYLESLNPIWNIASLEFY